jgi:hypothetical protein
VHGTEDVLLSRLAHGVLLVICEDDHVLSSVAEVLNKVGSHVANIVDTPAQLTALTEVVDADQQALAAACTVGVAVRVALRRPVAKVLGPRWGGWRTSTV